MIPIIEVRNLSKKYRIGSNEPYQSLRDAINNNFIQSLFDNNINKEQKNILGKDEFWSLKNLSFKIYPGEAVGIIGKNGSGKSTLFKILSRITPPTKGEVVLRGRVACLLEVGTGFSLELSGRENIFLNGAILGMRKSEIYQRFNDIVQFAELDKFLDTPVKHYSSGMYMRLAFSISAHLNPEILLVDEVLAVGDEEFQKKSLSKMEEVTKQKGRTILFVSHNLDMVKRLCKKSILLDKGKIIACGNTEQVIKRYHSTF